ncbi:MAG: glycosyltransferase, partial [Kiritimatiellia bacterium]
CPAWILRGINQFFLTWLIYLLGISKTEKTYRRFCFSPSNEMTFLGVFLASLIFRMKYVLFCWDPPGVSVRDRADWLSRFRCWVMDILFTVTAKRSKGVILNLHPEFCERRFSETVRKKFYPFPNGTRVVENQNLMVPPKDRIEKRIAVNSALSIEKGCWDIAHFFVRLWIHDPKVSLVWIGSGRERDSILNYFKSEGVPMDVVDVTGQLPHAEALEKLSTGSLAVIAYGDLPSLRWNYVLKAPEFLSLGCPIVSVRLPGVSTYIEEGETGVLFTPGDWNEAFEKTVALLDSPERIVQMRVKCLEVAKQFDWDTINQQITDASKYFSVQNRNGERVNAIASRAENALGLS